MAKRKHEEDHPLAGLPDELLHDPTLLDPLVTAMIAKIPNHVWPKAERDKWLAMLAQVFDLVYVEPVPPAPPPEGS